MTPPVGTRRLGVLGRDVYVDALIGLTRPGGRDRLEGVEVVAWWPGAAPAGGPSVVPGADVAPGLVVPSLSALWTAPGIEALFLAGEAACDEAVVRAVAASGLVAVGLLPLCPTLAVSGLRVGSALRASAAGAAAFAAVEGGRLGPVRLLDLERRVAGDPGAPGAALRRWAWGAVDLACAVFGGPPERVSFHGGEVLGGRRDHLQLVLRFPGDGVATADVIELPAWSGVRDLQLELVGERGAWRWDPPFEVPERVTYATPVADPAERHHAADAVRRLFADLRTVSASASRVAPPATPSTLAVLARLEAAWSALDEGVVGADA